MKTTVSILVLLLTMSIDLFACECPEYDLKKMDKESYDWSDIILIGDVIKTGTNYQIKVTEILKGNVENSIIDGTTVTEDDLFYGCSSFPSDKGKYLFYLKKTQKNGQIYYLYSQCLGTRKLDFETTPIALRTDKTKSELIDETEKWMDELRKIKK